MTDVCTHPFCQALQAMQKGSEVFELSPKNNVCA